MTTHTRATIAGLALTGLLPGLLAGLLVGGCGGGDSSNDTSRADGADPTEDPTADSTVPVIDPGDGGHYAPRIDAADFVATIDNPYMPLPVGARWTYEGVADGVAEEGVVVVTDQRREILGISAVVVHDTVSVAGEVTEDTYDWLAQDRDGNVWYLGEDTKEYEGGEVSSTEGSWEAGVDGALPGIVMPANPEVGQAYRQEFYPGEAEDLAEVTQVDATRSTDLGDHRDVVVTKEWNPLDPDVVENKYAAPGIGLIAEETVTGGDDTSRLTSVTGLPGYP
jgi:hypothetical protein